MDMSTGLTKQELKALRNADSIAFRFQRENENPHTIRAIQKGNNSSTGFDQEVVIPVDGRIENYSNWGSSIKKEYNNGFALISSSKYSPEWMTIASILKPGDKLKLIWRIGNDSEFMKEVGITHDELLLQVARGRKVMTFSVEHTVTSSTSLSRMFRS